jgi:hypothetical protein
VDIVIEPRFDFPWYRWFTRCPAVMLFAWKGKSFYDVMLLWACLD